MTGELHGKTAADQAAAIIDEHEWSHMGGTLGEQLAAKLAGRGLIRRNAVDADVHKTYLERMYEVADDAETAVLDELRVRSGVVWRCPRDWFNEPDRKACEDCSYRREDEPTNETREQ